MSVESRRATAFAFVLALIGAIASYIAAGATFGLFIGGVAFASLIAPPIAMVLPKRAERTFVALAVVVSNWCVWIFVIPLVDSLECAIVLLAFLLALLAFRVPSIAVAFALIWLSLPMWMRTDPVATLAGFHPLFAMNSACNTLGVWTQQPILYRLTTLGQDVPFALPGSIWPSVIAHAVIAMSMWWPIARNRSTGGDEPSDRRTTPTPPPAPPAPHTP
jgi:hypothetical protein